MTQEEELHLLALLGFCPADFQRVTRMPSYEQGVAELDALKMRVRKAFRKVSLQLHPDQNGGDAEKTALFLKLNGFVEKIEKLQLQPPAPPRMMVHPGFNMTVTGTATTVNVIYATTGGVRIRRY